MKHLALWITTAGFILATCASCAHLAPTPATLRYHDEQERTTVKVETMCLDGDIFSGDPMGIHGGRGSGVIVTERHVLTARHVVDCGAGIATVYVTTFEGKRYRAVVEREDADQDVARLVLMQAGNFNLGVKQPVVGTVLGGEAVCLSAAVPQREWSCGSVTAVGSNVRHTALTHAGNSGAGMYADGRLVGIVITRQFCGPEDLAGGEAHCGGEAARITPDWIPQS